jgi:hypothetical protein
MRFFDYFGFLLSVSFIQCSYFPRFITALITKTSVRSLGTLKQSNAFSDIGGQFERKSPHIVFLG